MNQPPTGKIRALGRASCTISIAVLLGLAGQAAGQPAPDPKLPPPIPQGEGPEVKKPTRALVEFENRPIRGVVVEGLKAVSEQLVRNQIRSIEGTPLREVTVQQDVQRLTRLGKFNQIDARVTPFEDGTVQLRYVLTETPIVRASRAVGNRQISDDELKSEIDLLEGTPIDRFQIDRLVRRIKDLYRKRGYYQADVTVDEAELSERGNLIFQIREGERLRITDIRFDGNIRFGEGQLRPQVKTDTWGIFFTGALDDSMVDQDVAALIQFYKDRGYLDVRVDREIRPSPDGKEAILTFIVSEGELYTLRTVRVELSKVGTRNLPGGGDPTVYTREQIAGQMKIKPGDVYSLDKLRKSVEAVTDAYGKLGYVDATISREEVRDPKKPEVDLLLIISEGEPVKTGLVPIKGNELTQQKVLRREIRLLPDRPLDTTAIKRTQDALTDLNLFENGSIKLTIQPPDETTPGYRDVLVEVKETNTGRLGFGAAVNTDLGLIGSIDFSQRNFDIDDKPDTLGEFLTGRAFRGAGQQFSISLQPGTSYQNYSANIAEPYLFESDYSGSIGGGYRRWKYDEYSESRTYANLALGRRFGERWVGGVTARAESINLDNFRGAQTVDLQSVAGTSFISGVGFKLSRSATDSNLRPTAGSRVELSAERVFGDFNFTKIGGTVVGYIPIYEDFFARRTVLTLKSSIAFIPEKQSDVPLFERFYLGGRDLRGFSYRGVSPRGVIFGTTPPVVGSDPVGGVWSVFNGAQVEQPLWKETISVVGFVDSGTVNESHYNLSKYRVAVGGGIRLYIPQLGPVPLAFDFAVPVRREEFDEKRIFSFSFEVPF